MSSIKQFSLHLAKDVELCTAIYYGNFTPAISVKSGDLNVDKKGKGDLKAIRDAIERLNSQGGRSMIEITPVEEQQDAYDYDYDSTINTSLSIKVLECFRELNHCGVLTNPFIRIDGTINATYGDPNIILNDKFNKRVSLNELTAAGQLHEVQLGSALSQYRNEQVQIKLKISILLEWTKQLITSVKLSGDSIVQKMYANESTKDYTIVTSNGGKVKCHGFILAAHSPVLDKMIDPSNGMKESKLKVILDENISEAGLKCLLQYLYGLKVSVDDWNCDLVAEIFQAAHYYQLEDLEKSLEEILLQKDDESWYTPDSILELYFFVKLLDKFEALRDYLLQTMTRMSLEIRKCERMKTLSVNDKVGLVWKLFDVSNNIKDEDHKEGQ